MVDFMALEAIRVFTPDSYNLIRRNKSIFTRLSARGALEQDENIDETKKIFGQIYKGESQEQEGELVKAVCRVIFPPLERIYANMQYSSESETRWRQQKRICSKQIFDKYFLLGVPKGEISDEEMKSILARSSNHVSLVEALNEVFEKKLGNRFLERMEDYLDIIQPQSIQETIIALFELEDKIAAIPREILVMGADVQAARIIYLLLKKVPEKDKRKQQIVESIERCTKLFLPVEFISLLSPEGNEEGAEFRTLRELEFSKEDAAELQQLCIRKIKQFAESGNLSKSPKLGMLLYRWAHWGDKVDAKSWVERLIETDQGVKDLLVGFMSEVISSDRGRWKYVNRKNIGEFVDIGIVEKKVDEIFSKHASESTDIEKEAIESFQRNEQL